MKINNYNDLEYAASKRLAVYCPNVNRARCGSLKNPRPASFVMNMDIRTINNAINAGLFIYVKENVQPVFFPGPGGALMCNREVKGLTVAFQYDAHGYSLFKQYGAWHMVGESMSPTTMKSICKQFNGIWEDREVKDILF